VLAGWLLIKADRYARPDRERPSPGTGLPRRKRPRHRNPGASIPPPHRAAPRAAGMKKRPARAGRS